MNDEPKIVRVDAQRTAVVRLTVPRAEIRNVMGPAYNELMAAVTAQGLSPIGPWFTHHFGVDPAVFDLEVGMIVAGSVSAAGRVVSSEWPAMTAARTIYHGDYEQLGTAWGEFDAWVAAHGHTPAEDFWERYLVGPESRPEPANWQTELTRPLVKQA